MSEGGNRYLRAMHAVQAGIGLELNRNPQLAEPKHVRVGINSCHITDAAIARLLIAKGVFTMAEYEEALALEAEAEVKRYEEAASASSPHGTDIKFI